MRVTLTMSKEELESYQEDLKELNDLRKLNDHLREYAEGLELDIAVYKDIIQEIKNNLYFSPYDNYVSVADTESYAVIRNLLKVSLNEESKDAQEPGNTCNESIPETDQVGSESSSD